MTRAIAHPTAHSQFYRVGGLDPSADEVQHHLDRGMLVRWLQIDSRQGPRRPTLSRVNEGTISHQNGPSLPTDCPVSPPRSTQGVSMVDALQISRSLTGKIFEWKDPMVLWYVWSQAQCNPLGRQSSSLPKEGPLSPWGHSAICT